MDKKKQKSASKRSREIFGKARERKAFKEQRNLVIREQLHSLGVLFRWLIVSTFIISIPFGIINATIDAKKSVQKFTKKVSNIRREKRSREEDVEKIIQVPIYSKESDKTSYQKIKSINFRACNNKKYSNEENIKRTLKGVVQIETKKGVGAGFVVSQARNQTLILTNSHVIGGQDTAFVSWSDQKGDIAYVVNDLNLITEYTDLAVLAVNKRYGKVLGLDKNNPQVGESVIAIGNPKGFGVSASQGMVSRISDQGKMIQTDAAFNPGISGGPLINNKGCVVGINTSMYIDSQGMNLSISAPLIRRYLGK